MMLTGSKKNIGTVIALVGLLALDVGVYQSSQIENDDFEAVDARNLTHNSTIRQADHPTWHIDYINTFQIIGNYAYCAVYRSGTLTILDISNPSAVTEAGYTSCPNAHDIKVVGDIAYVVSYTGHTLYTFNISNPSSITSLDSINVGGTHGMYLYVEDDYAYVAVWDSGTPSNNCLKIYNISNPNSISYVSQICDDGTNLLMEKPWGIAKIGNYLYIGCQTDMRTNIIDVSNINNPSYASHFVTGAMDADPLFYGDYYFAGGGSGNLKIYDISNPTSPNEVSNTYLNVYDYHKDIDSDGNFLYIRSGTPDWTNDNGVSVIDVSDKNNPVETDRISGAGSPGYYNRCHFNRIVGDTLYTVGYNNDSFITTNIDDGIVLDADKWNITYGTPSIDCDWLKLEAASGGEVVGSTTSFGVDSTLKSDIVTWKMIE